MTDIIEEARAMLARLNEGAFAWGNSHANQQGERLLAALADECERLTAALTRTCHRADHPASVVSANGCVDCQRGRAAAAEAEVERLLDEVSRLTEERDHYRRIVAPWVRRIDLDAAKVECPRCRGQRWVGNLDGAITCPKCFGAGCIDAANGGE